MPVTVGDVDRSPTVGDVDRSPTVEDFFFVTKMTFVCRWVDIGNLLLEVDSI